MKRIISIILTLAMCLSAVALLASCAAGESAYEIAVRHGYTGTEEEWYASLKGDKGDTGAAGAQGQKGDKGDKGETGDAGADGVKGDKGDKGETGDAGADGVNGTNGVDGAAGREIEFNVTPDKIEWRYKGESEWKTLVTLDEIRGEKGDKGEEGDKGEDGLTPTIGENGNWWIGNVDTGIYAGDKKEDGTAVVVKCTSLSFVEGACSIWATGTVPSLKIKYVLEDEAGNIVREGITNVTDGMLVGDYEFNGPDTYEDIVVKFLGFTSDPIDLTIDTTYDLVSPRVYAIGAEPVYQISKTVAGQEPEIITVTRDMIVKSNVDTSKAGKYSITINSPDGVPETFEIVVDGRIMSIADALNKAKLNDEVIITGTVSGFYRDWNATSKLGSPYLSDDEGNRIIIYNCSTNVTIGDVITVTGKIGQYNNVNQIAQGSTVVIDVPHVCVEWNDATCTKGPQCVICGGENGEALGHTDENEDAICEVCGELTRPLYVNEALEKADGVEVVVKGTVTQINTPYNSQYGNITVTITDEKGNSLYVYRLTGKVSLNQVITVYGKMGTYNGRQIAAGATFESNGTHTCTNFSVATCTEGPACIVCGKTNGAALGHIDNNSDNICDTCSLDLVATKVYQYTFTKTDAFTKVGEKTLNGVLWKVEGSSSYLSWDNNNGKGQQLGSSNSPFKTLTVTIGDFTNVTKIVINTCGASSINGSLTVTVGGTQIGNKITLTKTATGYTLESSEPLDGPIVLNYTQTSSKAIYIKSIEVTYQ